MLECKNLCFSYYKSPLSLKDVNFSLTKNSKNLFLASKDMGKTTFLKVLSGFEDSRFGNIYFNGCELKELSDKNKNFSLVFSDIVLFENKSIKYNLEYQLNLLEITDFDDVKLGQLLSIFNISADINQKVKKLPIIDKRKLQIARAFIKKPEILFLDDQFEGLSDIDVLEMLKIYEIIFEKFNSTIICAVGDETFKKIKDKIKDFNFDNVLYLCLAKIEIFRSISDFESSFISLDFLNFIDDVKKKFGFIEKNDNDYWFCQDELKLFKFDSQFNDFLDKLSLKYGEIEESIICLKTSVQSQNNDQDFNLILKNGDAVLFSLLTGNRVI